MSTVAGFYCTSHFHFYACRFFLRFHFFLKTNNLYLLTEIVAALLQAGDLKLNFAVALQSVFNNTKVALQGKANQHLQWQMFVLY